MPSAPHRLTLGDNALRRALRYPRFTRELPGVLVLDGGYHLHRECTAALVHLGCEVTAVEVASSVSATLRTLLPALVERRPDFILSINHIGFDEEGALAGLLEQADLPVAVWYVDSPLFILGARRLPAPGVTSLFVWERTLIPELRRHGAEEVHFLPLGTDARTFSGPSRPPVRPLVFVGDSMKHAQNKWGERIRRSPELAALARSISDRLLAGARLDELLVEHRTHPARGGGPFWDAVALGAYSATAAYRARLLRAVAASDLHVFGDEGWTRLLPAATWCGPLPYGPPLADVYASTAITLNATSYQMPTAVNQRVFDVPAAGGFLLTDDREDLHEHFRVGPEAVAYHDADTLARLVRYFAAHEDERAAVTARARERVLREHTYEQRLTRLIALMARRHGRARITRPRSIVARPVSTEHTP